MLKVLKKNTLSVAAAVIATAILFAGVYPAPIDATERQAEKTALEAAAVLAGQFGFNVRNEYYSGLLAKGGKAVVKLTLYEGNEYVLVGGGCRDCYDVDVLVYDENWNEVDRDQENKDVAVVKVAPKWSGEFYVVIHMYSSTSNGAHWVLVTGYK